MGSKQGPESLKEYEVYKSHHAVLLTLVISDLSRNSFIIFLTFQAKTGEEEITWCLDFTKLAMYVLMSLLHCSFIIFCRKKNIWFTA